MTYPVFLVMGVAGAGKTTIGKALAEALDAQFVDANDHHTKFNAAHMAAGKPLNDAMRWPWLDVVGDAVKTAAAEQTTVFACSALKRIYRDYLRASMRYQLIYPDASLEFVQKRYSKIKRRGFPAKLVKDQFQILSRPTKDEEPIIVSVDQPIANIVDEIRSQLA